LIGGWLIPAGLLYCGTDGQYGARHCVGPIIMPGEVVVGGGGHHGIIICVHSWCKVFAMCYFYETQSRVFWEKGAGAFSIHLRNSLKHL
jgi:hypothetical protein